MAGTALESDSESASPISHGTPNKQIKSHLTASPNGLRKGFLDNRCSPPARPDLATTVIPEVIEHIPIFSQAAAPDRKTASTTSVTLQLAAVTQTGLSIPLPEGAEPVPCDITYVVEMQQVRLWTQGLLAALVPHSPCLSCLLVTG